MKKLTLYLGLTFLLSSAFSQGSTIPHYDLEMTGQEYTEALLQAAQLGLESTHDAQLQSIIGAGTKNLAWLKVINSGRDNLHKLSLTSAQTQRGIPITKPDTYNREIVLKNFQSLLDITPQSIKDVVIGGGPMTSTPPIPDADFIEICRKIDRVYQSAARWILLSPYMEQLKAQADNDVRGYYFLSQIPDLKSQLDGWNSLKKDLQLLYTEYLIEICTNDGYGRSGCAGDLQSKIKLKNVYSFYETYISDSKTHYEHYFKLQVPRSDVTWKKNTPEEMHVPFHEPGDAAVKNFLVDNIQDEWKWNAWHLILDFTSDSFGVPKIVFEPGVTAHVNGIAGNTITMDANVPLTEYNLSWTIRHEYGHVLGFIDCYLEFYDEPSGAIINYQLDITNLMCSRRGHLQELHYQELRRAYGP